MHVRWTPSGRNSEILPAASSEQLWYRTLLCMQLALAAAKPWSCLTVASTMSQLHAAAEYQLQCMKIHLQPIANGRNASHCRTAVWKGTCVRCMPCRMVRGAVTAHCDHCYSLIPAGGGLWVCSLCNTGGVPLCRTAPPREGGGGAGQPRDNDGTSCFC